MSENLRAQLTAAIEGARRATIRTIELHEHDGAPWYEIECSIDRLCDLRAIAAVWDEDALHARTHAMHPDVCFKHTAEIEEEARKLLDGEAR